MLSVTQAFSDPGVIAIDRDGGGRVIATCSESELLIQVRGVDDDAIEDAAVSFPESVSFDQLKLKVSPNPQGDRVDLVVADMTSMRALADLQVICDARTGYGLRLTGHSAGRSAGRALDMTVSTDALTAIAGQCGPASK